MTRRKPGEVLNASDRAREFQDRQQAAGRSRFQAWLDADLLAALEKQAGALPAEQPRLERVNTVLRLWLNAHEQLTRVNSTSGNAVERSATDSKPHDGAGRVMSREMEERMLSLVETGVSYAEVGRVLAADGVVSRQPGGRMTAARSGGPSSGCGRGVMQGDSRSIA